MTIQKIDYNSIEVFKEIKNIWKNNFTFVYKENSKPVNWYDYMNLHNGESNCVDYALYVAYIVYKKYNLKPIIYSVGLQNGNKVYSHILPLYYYNHSWYLVNYIGTADISGIYKYIGDDSYETAEKVIDLFNKTFLPSLANHNSISYKTSNERIMMADTYQVKNVFETYYGKKVSQKFILETLFQLPQTSTEKWMQSKESMNENVYNINKILKSVEGLEVGFKPPIYYDDLYNKLKKYVSDYMKTRSNLITKFDIRDEVSKYTYKLPKQRDKLNWKSYYLAIPVISIDLKKQKEDAKEKQKVFWKWSKEVLNIDFEYTYKNESFYIDSYHPYFTNGNKRLTFYLTHKK
jgi:hypothetical protein